MARRPRWKESDFISRKHTLAGKIPEYNGPKNHMEILRLMRKHPRNKKYNYSVESMNRIIGILFGGKVLGLMIKHSPSHIKISYLGIFEISYDIRKRSQEIRKYCQEKRDAFMKSRREYQRLKNLRGRSFKFLD